MSGITPDDVPGMAARAAVSRLVSVLIDSMITVGEDPTDDALWARRKAEAITILRDTLDELPGRIEPSVLSPAEQAKVNRGLQTSPCRVSGESATDSPGQAR